ncbi:MAG TPA: hypothetical protein VIM41_06135 [Gammaproteobacteria bacterium]
MQIKTTAIALAGALMLNTSAMVLADTVTFEITATVYNVYDPGNGLQGSVFPGDKITGTYTIDTATFDNDPNPEFGYYVFNSTTTHSPQLGFDLTLNDHSFKSDPATSGHMYQAYVMNSSSDHFGLASWGNMPLANGSTVDNIFIDLYDPSGQALASDALTQQAPNVPAFQYHDIHVSGSAYNSNYYYLDAKIDAIQVAGGQCTPGNANQVMLKVNATVREVWDYDNVLGYTINAGDNISGTYTYNVNTPDSDPSPDFARYERVPGSGNYGFDITINSTTISTNTMTDRFSIVIGDGQGWPDFYAAEQFGTQLPFINGSIVNGLGVFVDYPSGNSITSTALTNQPPSLTNTGFKDFHISGMRDSTPYPSYFSIVADLNSITEVNACEKPKDPIVVSPGSGVFDRMQRFDAAIVMEPNLPPLVNMQATLNGFDITPELYRCFPGAMNPQNRQTMVCQDFSNILMPGTNTLNFTFMLGDGRSFNHSVDWLLLGY